MKDTFYLSHDYNTRSDKKIKKMLAKHGLVAYGVFWALVEDLYNNDNSLELDYDLINFDLRTDVDLIKSVIHDFDLFVVDGDHFGSLSVARRLEARNAKKTQAQKAAEARWKKKNGNADAMRPHKNSNDGNSEGIDNGNSEGIDKSDSEGIDNGNQNNGETGEDVESKAVNADAMRPQGNSNALKYSSSKDIKESIGEDSSSVTTTTPSPFSMKVRGKSNKDISQIYVDVGLLVRLKQKIPGLTDESIKLSFARVESYQRICPDHKIPKVNDLEYYLANWMMKDLSNNNTDNYKKNGNNTSTVEEYRKSRAKHTNQPDKEFGN